MINMIFAVTLCKIRASSQFHSQAMGMAGINPNQPATPKNPKNRKPVEIQVEPPKSKPLPSRFDGIEDEE